MHRGGLAAFATGTRTLVLLAAACSAAGQADQSGPHYYCAATAVRGSGPTLVVTEQVYPFNGALSAFPAAAPRLEASFAAYAANTWAGLTIAPVCRAEASRSAAEAARGAEVGSYEGQGYAIMRASYWQPG